MQKPIYCRDCNSQNTFVVDSRHSMKNVEIAYRCEKCGHLTWRPTERIEHKPMLQKMFKVYYSPNVYSVFPAYSEQEAKQKAWDEVKEAYSYGWTEQEFLKFANIERLK